jgi:mono/diheme cytochrome c family protein
MPCPAADNDQKCDVISTGDPSRRIAMYHGRAALVLGAALSALSFSTKGQDGDIAAGHAFTREACKACHDVEPEESSSRMIEIGPAFCDVANTPGMTATAIRVFLTSSHPKMPNFILTPEEIADVTAYIVS